MIALPLLLVALATASALLFTVQIGALGLAGGLLLIAFFGHTNRARRTPWRSQRADVATLVALAALLATLALLLP